MTTAGQIDHGAESKGSTAQRAVLRAEGFVEKVFAIIRADLMALKIKPGSRISIDRLSRELGVSQTPIREALSMLEAIGLVVRRHHSGYWSTPQLSAQQIDDLFEFRLLVEPFAARMAASRMSDADLAELDRYIMVMTGAATDMPYDVYADHDAGLHNIIARGSGNAMIGETLDRLHAHLHIFRLRSTSLVTANANREHVAITQALHQRDPDAAEAAMRYHIEQSRQRLYDQGNGAIGESADDDMRR